MALPMWQPNQIPSNNVVADPTGLSSRTSTSSTPYWAGYYGRSGVTTPQSSVDENNARVKRESECPTTPPWLR